jgi:serine phosphatase RsbU (regulator of sigma subunit)
MLESAPRVSEPTWFLPALTLVDGDALAGVDEPFLHRVHWTLPHIGPGGELVMTAAAGCRAEGTSDAVVALEVRLRSLGEFTRSIEITPNGSVTLMTDQGLTDEPRIITRSAPGIVSDDPSTWFMRTPAALGVSLVDNTIAAFADRPPTLDPVRFFSDGEVWWAQVRPFALSGEQGLLIAVLLPTADLLADRNRVALIVLGLTLVAILAAIQRAVSLSRRVSKPIEALANASERIARGDLDQVLAVDTRLTEVRRLAEAHETMREGLRSLMRLERDMQLARQIQQGTLPEVLPAIPGYQLAAWSEPADATGGDTYDVVPLPLGAAPAGDADASASRVVLLVADASGHGIAPALCVTQMRAMLRMALRASAPLAELLGHLNRQLWEDLPGNRFITVWLGELDSDAHQLRWLSAGQAPILHYRAAVGRVETLAATTYPLGLFPELANTEPRTLSLEPGDVVAIPTDGLFEARDGSDHELGVARVVATLEREHACSAQEIVTALRRAGRDWTANAPLADDCSVMVLRRNA